MEMLTAAEICRNTTSLAPLESQKEYRERITAFIRMHTARIQALDSGISPSSLPGNSMLIIAQTGCGKTYTASQLCKAAGVNLITIDCSALTLAGYKGCNLGELLFSAQSDATSKVEFEQSIILFDEVDKMRIDGSNGNPQANFLKLFDGIIHAEPRGQPITTLNVSRMSFLFAGAFAGLEDIIRRKIAPRSIGFSTNTSSNEQQGNLLSRATMADIREYGFMEELLGRIGTLLYVPPLTTADYRTLLKGGSGSVCARYANLLGTTGVTLDISDSACSHIARKASESALGARAVDPLVYSCMQGAFEKLDRDKTINCVTIICQRDRLALRFGHGERTCAAETHTQEPVVSPDVSIARYLKSEKGVQELLNIALDVFGKPGTDEERRLKVFLRCCFRFMRTLGREEDKVLSSVTKLADTTQPDDGDNSIFDRIVSGRLNKQGLSKTEHKKLFGAYLDFCQMRSDENHQFWVEASKELRRKWYRNLLRQAG